MDANIIKYALFIASQYNDNDNDSSLDVWLNYSLARAISKKLVGFKPEDFANARDLDLCVLACCLGLEDEAELYRVQKYGSESWSGLAEGPAITPNSALWATALRGRRVAKEVISTPTVEFVPYAVPWLLRQSPSIQRRMLYASTSPKINKVKRDRLIHVLIADNPAEVIWEEDED